MPFRSICPLIRRLDEHRSRANSLLDLFDEDVSAWRQELVGKCEDAFFDDQDCVSPKPREILWRKGYYDTISMAKRFVHKHYKSQAALDGSVLAGMDKLCAFIEEGIMRLKKIIVRIEADYNLDLKYLVDFTLFGNGEEAELQLDQFPSHEEIPINKKITSLEIINFALESIHSLIISLGDLHRYYLDFGLHKQFNPAITKQLTANYYEEAFKLNPKNGMPQNQLGTLWFGRNCNLDSVYYYLYSLVCPKPFELSEDNVVKIFQQSAAYLEDLVMEKDYQVSFQDFIARFLLVADIFFFDKNVPTFNDLCRLLLCDLNYMLRQGGESVLDQDILFKLTAILFFCMRKLKRTNSPKVFQLNAFLAAICDQFVESCNVNFEEFFAAHSVENEAYQQRYQDRYAAYTQREPKAERAKMLIVENGQSASRRVNGLNNGLSSTSTTDGVSQDAYGGGSSNERKSIGDGQNRRTTSNGSGAAAKKRAPKYRRRRRRSTYTSDSDLTSNFDSDSEGEEDNSELSDEDQDSGEEDINYEDEDSEEEELEKRAENGTVKWRNGSAHVKLDSDENNDSDVIIEEETVVVKTNGESVNGSRTMSPFTPLNGVAAQLEEMRIGDVDFGQQHLQDERRGDRTRQKVPLVKCDPNLLLKFVEREPTIRALKLLLDWLMDNKEIIWECFQSNPEFVHKIMVLLNSVNVNIFTRKVFFERQLLTTEGLREDIRSLFDARAKLPITEDLVLKHFGEFNRSQVNLDWEIYSQMKVTAMEENLLRIIKLKNFGFFICDRKKFGYAFRSCSFEQIDTEQVKRRKNAKRAQKRDGGRQGEQKRGNDWGSGSGSGETRRERRRRQRKQQRNGEPVEGRRNMGNGDKGRGGRTAEGRQQQQGRNREEGSGDVRGKDKVCREKEMLKKGELMGKLWLRNEVKTLESKVSEEKLRFD